MMTLPDQMTAAIADVLGRPNFACIGIANVLRRSGQVIETKAEAEQAAVIWFLLPFAIEHGDNWRDPAHAKLKEMVEAVKSTEQPTAG